MRRLLPAPLLLLVSCSTPGAQKGDLAPPTVAPPVAGELPAGVLHRTSRETGFGSMIDELAKADFVYVGEGHTTEAHHLAQLRIAEQLLGRGRLRAIGMEMFQRRFQPVLDEYTQGRIGEAEMLERTEYKKRWGYDYALYRPILEFARARRLPVIALNVEAEISAAVRKGGLDALTEEQRRSLPALHDRDEAHRAFLRESYKAHLPAGGEIDEEKFARFYTGMLLWDDTMADSIVQWAKRAGKDAQMVVFAGAGHIANRYGVPERVHRRIGRPYLTVVPQEIDKPTRDMLAHGYADFVWATAKKP